MQEFRMLPNGVTLAYERIPGARTTALGIWVQSGARHEPEELCGISHLLEHMVFKGTENRTARALAEEMDAIGGQINAFTAMDCTCFYARVLDTHAQKAADLLCDMVFHARLSDSDLKLERGVVFEEIGMYQDSPEDLAADRLNAAIYRGSALGRPILGTKKALRAMTGETLRTYRDSHYVGSAVVVSVAGSFDEALLAELSERFSSLPSAPAPAVTPAEYTPSITLCKKETEQNHLCIAFPALPYGSPERHAMRLLNSLVGGGMSSLLFQSVREEAGLCYAISSFVSTYEDLGSFCIYTATHPGAECAALSLIREELCRLSESITEEKLCRVREQAISNIYMGLESTVAHMNTLANGIIREKRLVTPEEVVEALGAVTLEQVRSLAKRIFDFSRASISVVGTPQKRGFYRAWQEN
ncbi:MAG: insulinase family protein [Oscillospiraceae bacterium]|nr:insulinase family protein [Oscillospiraceae bacterium]